MRRKFAGFGAKGIVTQIKKLFLFARARVFESPVALPHRPSHHFSLLPLQMGNAYSTSINVQTWRCAERSMGGARVKGRRHDMEDFDACVPRFVNPTWDFLVCLDGHGGKESAAFVSKRLPEVLATHLTAESSVAEIQAALERSFEQVDTELLAASSDGSGACCVCAVITPTHFIVAFCGDCVAFLFRATGFTRITREITRDHEPSLPDERARIEAAGSRVYVNEMGGARIDGDLNVSRAFGDGIFKRATRTRMPRFDKDGILEPEEDITGLTHKTFAITAHPDVVIVERTPQDVMLLLGSDGLVDLGITTDKTVIPKRLWEALHLQGMSDPSRLATLACDHAYINGSGDNLTALLWTSLPPSWPKSSSEQDTEWASYMAGRRALLRRGERDLDEPDGFPASHTELE
jgi:serine/threonine protein phosphatase PrpC